MAKASTTRPVLSFSRGINTDANFVTYPADFARDMENYEIQQDGSVRRRAGLALDSVNQELPVNGLDTAVMRTFKWKEVNENPLLNFIMLQIGADLYFMDDVPVPGITLKPVSISLISRRVADVLPSDFDEQPVWAVSGRGKLFVVGKHIHPFFLAYDENSGAINVGTIQIRERDFEGVPDGFDDVTQPAALTDLYKYNLLNSGWKQTDIDTFFGDKSVYPSKNMIPALGYRRADTPGFNPDDGTKEFSSDKLVGELFQDAPAPKGHFIRDPFNKGQIQVADATADLYGASPFTVNGSTGDITFSISTHSLVVTDEVLIVITGAEFGTPGDVYYNTTGGGVAGLNVSGRVWEITAVPDNTHITITTNLPDDFVSYFDTDQGVTIYLTVISVPGAIASPYRPTTAAFFAGRIWYAGTPYQQLSSKIFFSQVIESDTQLGKCYQVADPTDSNISDVVATDGGTFSIPEAGLILCLKSYSASLLVYASNGVWEIGPGANGYFAANSYSIRKISDVPCVGQFSVVHIAESIPMFWGLNGIYTILQDTNTGYLTVRSATEGLINNLVNKITLNYKQKIQGVYDDFNKRVVWLYGQVVDPLVFLEKTRYNFALVFDTRFGAFYKLKLPTYTKSAFVTKPSVSSDGITDLKFVLNDVATDDVQIAVLSNRDDFTDVEDGEIEAFILTGFDTVDNANLRKYAPFVHVYSKKTERGFELVGDDEWAPIGPSSTFMRSRWDWADDEITGKWGTSQQVYRHVRFFNPIGPSGGSISFNAAWGAAWGLAWGVSWGTNESVPIGAEVVEDSDGYPVVVTRNKVRGRGRVLQLYFSAGDQKDSHLLGFSTDYNILTNR